MSGPPCESLRGLKHYDRAIAELETALELKPKDADLQVSLAETFSLADRKVDAKKLVDEVLKQKPDHEAERTTKVGCAATHRHS